MSTAPTTPKMARANKESVRVLEVVIPVVFFVVFDVGAQAAAQLRGLSTAKQLAHEDEVCWARYQRAVER
jgi:hypothetical protein